MSKAENELVSQIQETMGEAWLPHLYRDRVLKMRTRSYEFPVLPKSSAPEIQHTLLGIELKVGRRRMLCPDLATARYLRVFARARCRAVAIPYDITRISQIADELESSWHRMFLIAGDLESGSGLQRLRQLLVAKVRNEIGASGAGARIPEFADSTKQRRR
jgi:hypothetical protein